MRLPLFLALLLTLPLLPAGAAEQRGHGAIALAPSHGFRHGHPLRLRRAPVATLFPGYWDWGWDAGWVGDAGAGAAAPALPRPARFAADARPTSETTPQGVTIMRGPGSRHFLP